jgi:IS30 family transposase
VISREIKNNSTEDGRYQSFWAQNRSAWRRCTSRIRERLADPQVREYVWEKLPLGWSPQQIAGRLALDMPGKHLSYETIYQYVFKKERSLTKYLVCGRKNRRKRIHKRGKRILIPNRIGIERRPVSVNKREELGHWEADTAVSRQSKEALMVLQERTMGLTLLRKLPRCAPEEMNAALIARLENFPETMRRTVTFDNGQENRRHKQLCDELKIKTFFCNPYSSWQKGSVENAVGLTRREWPKKTDYALISDKEISILEHRLNTRPRKRLGYRTPLELLASVALSP